jgi:urease accessory protein
LDGINRIYQVGLQSICFISPVILLIPSKIRNAMSDHLTLIHHLPPRHHAEDDEALPVALRADRHTLAKRRWRAKATDGREFGFDLATPLAHSACFFLDGKTRYVIEQQPEAVLEIPIATPEDAARLGWQIGNLHLLVQVLPAVLRVADDPAAAQMLAREGIAFQRHDAVFQPLAAGAAHHHPPHAHE